MNPNKKMDEERERGIHLMLGELAALMAMLGRAEALLENAKDIEDWRRQARSSLAELMEMITGKESTPESVGILLDYKTLFAEHFREELPNPLWE